MDRMTKLSENTGVYVTEHISGKDEEEGFYGEAIDKLANFEDMVEHLMERQSVIHAQLEELRNLGKSKTVSFKDLLGEKLVNEMVLNHLGRYGLK